VANFTRKMFKCTSQVTRKCTYTTFSRQVCTNYSYIIWHDNILSVAKIIYIHNTTNNYKRKVLSKTFLDCLKCN
jgi:hypothetical protein